MNAHVNHFLFTPDDIHLPLHVGRDLLDRYPISDRVLVTALLVSPGYFWIGTSVGIIMVYRIPLIESVPLITAKPYLAMDGHKGQVQSLSM